MQSIFPSYYSVKTVVVVDIQKKKKLNELRKKKKFKFGFSRNHVETLAFRRVKRTNIKIRN